MTRPNIVFIMSDDHAAHAIGATAAAINRPRISTASRTEGCGSTTCFCTNSICAPSRATILTGTYSHVNGVPTLSSAAFDASQPTFPECSGPPATRRRSSASGTWATAVSRPARLRLLGGPAGQGCTTTRMFLTAGRRASGPRATSPTSSPTWRWTGSTARPDRPVLPADPSQGAAPPLGAGRSHGTCTRRRHPGAGHLRRRLRQPGPPRPARPGCG